MRREARQRACNRRSRRGSNGLRCVQPATIEETIGVSLGKIVTDAGYRGHEGFDGGSASQRPFDGLGEAALVAGDMDLEHLVLWRSCQLVRELRKYPAQHSGGISMTSYILDNAVGLVTPEEIDRTLSLFDNPGFVFASPAMFSAWGQRPQVAT